MPQRAIFVIDAVGVPDVHGVHVALALVTDQEPDPDAALALAHTPGLDWWTGHVYEGRGLAAEAVGDLALRAVGMFRHEGVVYRVVRGRDGRRRVALGTGDQGRYNLMVFDPRACAWTDVSDLPAADPVVGVADEFVRETW